MEPQEIPENDKGLGVQQHTVKMKKPAVGQGLQDPPHGRFGYEGPAHPELRAKPLDMSGIGCLLPGSEA